MIYLIFPHIVFSNLQKVNGNIIYTYNYEKKSNSKEAVILSHSLSNHFTGIFMNFSYMKLGFNRPLLELPLKMKKKLLLLQFSAMVDKKIGFEKTIYYNAEIRNNPITDSFYLCGYRSDGELFLAISRIVGNSIINNHNVDLSNHSKKLIKISHKITDEYYFAIERYNASCSNEPIWDNSNQVINLAAAFECLIDIEFNASKKSFSDKIGSYYRNASDILEWCSQFYDLRNAIHHGHRINKVGMPRKESTLLVKNDFIWKPPRCDYSGTQLSKIGKGIFIDIFYKKTVGKRININKHLKNLITNEQILKNIREFLKSNTLPNNEFNALVKELNLGDNTGIESDEKFIIEKCFAFLIKQDTSLIKPIGAINSFKSSDKETFGRCLLGLEELIRKSDYLSMYISPTEILNNFSHDVYKTIKSILEIFRIISYNFARRK